MLARSGSPRSATSSRARCSTASTSSSPCRGRERRSSPRPPRRAPSRFVRRVVAARERLRAELPRRTRPAADELLGRAVDRLPLSARGRARVARCRPHRSRARGSDAVEQEHVAEALAYRSPQGAGRVSELALAPSRQRPTRTSFGSRGPCASPASARPSTSTAARERLARRGLALPRAAPTTAFRRSSARSTTRRPGLFVRGAAEPELLARPALRDRRRTRMFRVRSSGRAPARPRAGGGRPRRRQRPRARRRRRGASRRARGWRRDRRRARLRHRPRLSGGTRDAGASRSPSADSSSPSTARAWSPPRGGFRPATASSPASAPPPRRRRGAGAERGVDHRRFRARRRP